MSATTGRMSRADALHAIDQIIAAAMDFTGNDAPPATAAEASTVLHVARSERDYLDSDRFRAPNALVIRKLRSQVAALQADRLFRSSAVQPYTVRASVVFLPGIPDSAHAIGQAAHLAAQDLGLRSNEVVLQDCSNVRTATFTGIRYIFLPRTLPHSATAL